jgi:RNA recognition motif-containing protein
MHANFEGNIPPEVDEEALKAAFIPFGEIKSVDIPIDHATGKK